MARKAHDWEEAMNDLVEEKNEILEVLITLVTLWEEDAPMSQIENYMYRARLFIDMITKPDSIN